MRIYHVKANQPVRCIMRQNGVAWLFLTLGHARPLSRASRKEGGDWMTGSSPAMTPQGQKLIGHETWYLFPKNRKVPFISRRRVWRADRSCQGRELKLAPAKPVLRILDRIEPASPIMPAERCMAESGMGGGVKDNSGVPYGPYASWAMTSTIIFYLLSCDQVRRARASAQRGLSWSAC